MLLTFVVIEKALLQIDYRQPKRSLSIMVTNLRGRGCSLLKEPLPTLEESWLRKADLG